MRQRYSKQNGFGLRCRISPYDDLIKKGAETYETRHYDSSSMTTDKQS